MKDTLDRLPPRAGRGTRLGLAAAVWTAVGTGLVAAAVTWLSAGAGVVVWVLVPCSLALGWLKARFVLRGLVRRNARRISEGPASRFVGTVFSGPNWLLAVGFMVFGIALRRTPVPRPYLAPVYLFAGSALLLASMDAWSAWRAERRAHPAR